MTPSTSLPVVGRSFSERARGLGKSERTRARIMDETVAMIAEQGLAAASANAIAKAAGISNGAFYLHFRDRDHAVGAVAMEIARSITRRLDEAMAGVEDAVERNAWATRQFIEIAAANAEWGRALSRGMASFSDLRGQANAFLREDLLRGVAQGVFTVTVDDFLIESFLALAAVGLRERLKSGGPDAGSRTAELQLRMLGVDAARARETAWRPLEPRTDLAPTL